MDGIGSVLGAIIAFLLLGILGYRNIFLLAFIPGIIAVFVILFIKEKRAPTTCQFKIFYYHLFNICLGSFRIRLSFIKSQKYRVS